MPRKLKTFVTSVGFFDLAVAAPSMKAALDAWGFGHNAFQQGFAGETHDAQIMAAAMAKPGIVLRRPVGTAEPFQEGAELPRGFEIPDIGKVPRSAPKSKTAPKLNVAKGRAKPKRENAELNGVVSFQKEKARRDRERALEEANQARNRQKRQLAIERARSRLDDARALHEHSLAKLNREQEILDSRLKREQDRWNALREKLEFALGSAQKD